MTIGKIMHYMAFEIRASNRESPKSGVGMNLKVTLRVHPALHNFFLFKVDQSCGSSDSKRSKI